MNLTYRCRSCDSEIDLNIEYNKYVDGKTDDTIEDEECPNCGYINVLEVNIETT